MLQQKGILLVSEACPGTVNDKTMVKSDDFIKALKEKHLHSEYEYTICDRHGNESRMKGLYVTVDGADTAIITVIPKTNLRHLVMLRRSACFLTISYTAANIIRSAGRARRLR